MFYYQQANVMLRGGHCMLKKEKKKWNSKAVQQSASIKLEEESFVFHVIRASNVTTVDVLEIDFVFGRVGW